MHFVWIIISVTLSVSQIHSSLADSDILDLHVCMKNKTIAIQVAASNTDDTRCQCQYSQVADLSVREDYVHTPGIGSHKLHTVAKTWNEARKICNEENGHLAVINSLAEAETLNNIFRREASKVHGTQRKDQAYIGIHDMFNEGEWLTIFGESLYSTGFAGWSSQGDCYGSQPDNFGGKQNCGTFLLNCLKMDDIECYQPLAFFCELPISCA